MMTEQKQQTSDCKELEITSEATRRKEDEEE
jgi:hypothetical protein